MLKRPESSKVLFSMETNDFLKFGDRFSEPASAKNQVEKNLDYLSIHQTCFDIIQDIRNRIKKLPIKIKWRWVEEHQRERGRRKLDWWACQNERAIATSYNILSPPS